MFDIGITEWLMIVIVLLIFVRPEDLPSLMRKLGELYGKMLRLYYSFYDAIRSEERK